MLDVALFMSNATRLKSVLEQGPFSQYYATLLTLISVSLLLQVVIGILLVVIGKEPSLETGFLTWRPLVVGKAPALHVKLSSHLLREVLHLYTYKSYTKGTLCPISSYPMGGHSSTPNK